MEFRKNNLAKQLNAHPCLSCGACCAYYRVSFDSSETLPEKFHVPNEMVAPVNSHESAMKGTDTVHHVRCIALKGLIGKDASCTIYENRPSPCRKFEASYERGVKEPRCDEARAASGLSPLKLQDYDGFRNRR